MVPIVRVMIHRIIEKGIANEKEIDIDTLEYRLQNCTYIKEMVFCARAKKYVTLLDKKNHQLTVWWFELLYILLNCVNSFR